jgi:hypothetical protein
MGGNNSKIMTSKFVISIISLLFIASSSAVSQKVIKASGEAQIKIENNWTYNDDKNKVRIVQMR